MPPEMNARPVEVPWFDITRLPRREMLARVAKGASLRTLRDLLQKGDVDRIARSVLEAEIAVREHYRCD